MVTNPVNIIKLLCNIILFATKTSTGGFLAPSSPSWLVGLINQCLGHICFEGWEPFQYSILNWWLGIDGLGTSSSPSSWTKYNIHSLFPYPIPMDFRSIFCIRSIVNYTKYPNWIKYNSYFHLFDWHAWKDSCLVCQS